MVKHFPVLATALIEVANVGQIVQMYREQSSAGQSAVSYVVVILALCLWERFFAIQTPDQKSAAWTIRVSIVVNVFVVGSVIYFR